MTRSFVVATALPLPASSGDSLRAWQNVAALAGLGPVGVFGLRADEPAPPPREGIEVWCSSREPSLTDPARLSSLDWLRDPVAVPWDQYFSPSALGELEETIERFRPDVVVFEELELYRYVAPLTGRDWRLVLDLFKIGSVFHRELAGRSGRVGAVVHAELAKRIKTIESSVIPLVDQVWACSPVDAELVRTRVGSRTSITVVPNTIDVDAYRPEHAYRPRPTLTYPAMFAYPPNEAAALLLAREIVPPLAKQFADLRLVLVGRNPTRTMLDTLAADPRVEVTGAVPDIRPYLAEAGAVPIPLFDGSGTRLKALEAFAAGVPVVSTSKGIEGIDAQAETHFLLAEAPEEFVTAITRLWSVPETASRLVERARSFVAHRYSWDVARRAVAETLDRLAP